MNEDFDPRSALDAAEDSRRRLADRLVTPVWYHPLFGLTLLTLAYALGMPEGALEHRTRLYLLCGTALVAGLGLPWLYRHQTGVRIRQATGPRSRRFLLWCLIPFTAWIGALAASNVWSGQTWLPPALGVVALLAAVVCGRRYDNLVRGDLWGECAP